MSQLTRNAVKDQHIDYVLKKNTIYPAQMVTVATVTNTGVASLTTGFGGFTTPPVLGQMSNGMLGVRFTSITDGAANPEIAVTVPLDDFDNSHPIYVRYQWSTDATAVCSLTGTVRFATNTAGNTPRKADTALSNAIAVSSKTDGLANSLVWSSWGKIGPLSTGVFANITFPAVTESLNLNLRFSTINHVNVALSYVWVTALQVAYTPRITFGGGSRREARHMTDGLSGMAAGPAVDF